jgi:hypothetical protein
VSGQFHSLVTLPWETAPSAYWIRDWVGPKAGVKDMAKWKFMTLPGFQLHPFAIPTALPWLSMWIGEWWIGNDLEGSSHGPVEAVSQCLLGDTKVNNRNLSQNSWCCGGHSNQACHKRRSGPLLQGQHLWSCWTCWFDILYSVDTKNQHLLDYWCNAFPSICNFVYNWV